MRDPEKPTVEDLLGADYPSASLLLEIAEDLGPRAAAVARRAYETYQESRSQQLAPIVAALLVDPENAQTYMETMCEFFMMYGVQLSQELDAANREDRLESFAPRAGEHRVNIAVDALQGGDLQALGYAIGETVKKLPLVQFVRVTLPAGTNPASNWNGERDPDVVVEVDEEEP